MQVELALISRKTGRVFLEDRLPDVFREYHLKEATTRSASTPTGHYLFQFVNGENYVVQYYHILALQDDEILTESNIPTLFLLMPTQNFLEFAAGGSKLMLMHERYFNFFYVPTKLGEMVLQKGQSYSGLVIHFSQAYIDQYASHYPFAEEFKGMMTKKEVNKLFHHPQRVSSDLLYLIESLLHFPGATDGQGELEIRIDNLTRSLLRSVSEDTLKRMVHIQEGLIHKIYTIKNHLLQHMHERIQMGAVARLFDISMYAMTQGFQEIYGFSPSEFLYEERMRKALLLLQSGNLSKAQVAEMVGYDNVDSFRVALKRKYGSM